MMEPLDALLARRYPFRAIVEPAGGWSVVFPDLPGCTSYAETWAEIGTNAALAVRLWIEAEHSQGHPIPPPTIGDEAVAIPPDAFDVTPAPAVAAADDRG